MPQERDRDRQTDGRIYRVRETGRDKFGTTDCVFVYVCGERDTERDTERDVFVLEVRQVHVEKNREKIMLQQEIRV